MALDQITLLYQVSPIILTGGLASNISGGMLPLLALTNPNAFNSNLLNGNENFALEDAFGIFQPAVGGTLVEQIIAQYPFANLSVAANAIIRNPINVSMIMLTPMKQISSWSVKQLTMSSLKATLDSHNNAGGTYTVCTPAFIYTDMLMVGVVDVSMAQSPIPQNAWRWDFTKPLVTLTDASGAMNNLMNQINSGAQPSAGGTTPNGDPTGGTPSTSDPATAIGQPPSIMNTGAGAGATAPGASILPFIGPTGGNIFDTPVSPFSGATSTPISGGSPFLPGSSVGQNPGSQRPPPGTLP